MAELFEVNNNKSDEVKSKDASKSTKKRTNSNGTKKRTNSTQSKSNKPKEDNITKQVKKTTVSDIVLTESDYWHGDKLLRTDSDINMVIGQRGNGKSFWVAEYCLKQYEKHKRKFIYLRRWDTDLKGYRIDRLFDNIPVEDIFGPGTYIRYYQHSFRLMSEDGELIDTIGYAESINEAHHTKSIPYDEVDTIWFDEFIQMKGEHTLTNELNMFENILSTIIRSRTDVKVFMLANTVSKFSPYFTHWGFNINKVTQGSINTKEFETDAGILRVSFEYCEFNEKIAKKTSKYVQSNMITKGEWEIDPTDDIPTATNEIVKDKLLFSAIDPDTNVNVCCYVRNTVWETLENINGILSPKKHRRQFLVLKQSTDMSRYYHLSEAKSLTYTSWLSLELMLKDILERVGIDVKNELMMGRVFCDNPFTADYFNHIWKSFSNVPMARVL